MAAVDDFKILDEAVKSGKRSVTLPDGRTFTLDEARDERDRLKKEIAAEKAAKDLEELLKNKEIKNAENLVQNASEGLAQNLRAFNKGRASAEEVFASQLELQNLQEGLARLKSATVVTAPVTGSATAVSGGFTKTQVEKLLSTSGPGAPGATATGATATATGTTGATGATATGATATGTTAPQPKIVVTKAQVDKKLVELGLEDTPANRKIARQELKTGTTAAPGAVDTSWEPLFKQNYPQYSWMFTDLDRTKYADVFSLFFEAINPKTGEQAMEDVEFDRRWKGTSFYRELETSKKGRELSAAIGNFSWSSGQLAKFLTKATQFGYEGENLKQQAYTELFSKVDNKYVNDLAVKEVRASSPYLALKRIGTQYLTALNDETVETALVGGKTADDLLRTSRELAKAMYPHLKDSIDAGVTLEDLAANYKQVAARTLELDPSQVDMGLKFNEALNYTKDGKSRMLSLGEWETELRTNDKYKYKFTKQANQDATDIGLAIARAFGKVQ